MSGAEGEEETSQQVDPSALSTDPVINMEEQVTLEEMRGVVDQVMEMSNRMQRLNPEGESFRQMTEEMGPAFTNVLSAVKTSHRSFMTALENQSQEAIYQESSRIYQQLYY